MLVSGWRVGGVVVPVSQIWALMVLESTAILRVANSTPIVDFDSILQGESLGNMVRLPEFIASKSTQQVWLSCNRCDQYPWLSFHAPGTLSDVPTPESPISTTTNAHVSYSLNAFGRSGLLRGSVHGDEVVFFFHAASRSPRGPSYPFLVHTFKQKIVFILARHPSRQPNQGRKKLIQECNMATRTFKGRWWW